MCLPPLEVMSVFIPHQSYVFTSNRSVHGQCGFLTDWQILSGWLVRTWLPSLSDPDVMGLSV